MHPFLQRQTAVVMKGEVVDQWRTVQRIMAPVCEMEHLALLVVDSECSTVRVKDSMNGHELSAGMIVFLKQFVQKIAAPTGWSWLQDLQEWSPTRVNVQRQRFMQWWCLWWWWWWRWWRWW